MNGAGGEVGGGIRCQNDVLVFLYAQYTYQVG